MSRNVMLGWLMAIVVTASSAWAQTIVKSAQGNPANGHRYVMISAASWEQARTWARARGGDLATVDDAAEDAWMFTTFSPTAGKYTIGLAAVDVPGTLTWSDGSTSSYRAWASGEPSLTASERYTVVQGAASWTLRSTSYAPNYIVEWSGPVKVPQEYPTLAEGLAAMSSSGEREMEIDAGTYALTSAQSLPAVSTGRTIRGAGRAATVISFGTTGAVLTLAGPWTIENLGIWRGAPVSPLNITSGSLLARDVNVNSNFYLGVIGMFRLWNGSSLVLNRCEIQQALYMTTTVAPWFGSVHASNSVFRNCGSLIGENLTGTFSNCTISPGSNGSIRAFSGPTQMVNCVVWPMTNDLGDYVTARNCLIQRDVPPGEGNISVNPQFVSGTTRPAAGSPCIDAGDTDLILGGAKDIDGLARVSGASVDLGAYELTQTPPPVCDADFNGDGFITFEDFDAFVAAFEEGC